MRNTANYRNPLLVSLMRSGIHRLVMFVSKPMGRTAITVNLLHKNLLQLNWLFG